MEEVRFVKENGRRWLLKKGQKIGCWRVERNDVIDEREAA
jgi:hypothetical protein